MKSGKTSMMLWMLGGMMLAGLTACSGDDAPTDVADDGVKVRHITITQSEDAATRALVGHASQRASDDADATLGKATGRRVSGNGVAHYVTRATLTEGDGLTASWTAGDVLSYCNLSRKKSNGDTYNPIFGNLTASSTAATSQFTGDVTCKESDYLAVVYPATSFETNDSYTISLTGQDGTLATLATRFHFVYGLAHVTEAQGQTATATMEKMKSLLTVCKFSFIDQAASPALPLPITTLTIAYGGSGSDAGTYPQSATVTVRDKDKSIIIEQSSVHAAGIAGNKANNDPPLTITANGLMEVYVALLPTAAPRTFNFTVTNSSGTYTGTATATLNEGEFMDATGLKLTKQ